jgi:hypothetical protein
VDEASLALNIVNRSFLGLLKPLDFDQGAPIGFLLLQKASISFLGSRDYTLRLIPLLAGLVSIPLMYLVSNKYAGRLSSFISLGLFTLSPKLIYYSSELKQYSTDVLATLVLLFIVPKCLEDKAKPHAFVVLGIAGSLLMWISHPSLFVFSAVFLTLFLTFAVHRDSYRLSWLIGIGVAWGISLGLVYFTSLRYLESNKNLLNYWRGSFAPLPPWNNFSWFNKAFIAMLRDPATLPVNAATVLLLILGIFSFAFRRWQYMLLLAIPFLLALIASALGRYPFVGRLLLFLMPVLLLLLAEGVKRVGMVLLRMNKPIAWLVSACLVSYFFYGPIAVAYKNLRSPPMGEDIKPVMSYMSEKSLSTDLIYVYYGADPAFEFYAPLYGLDRKNYVVGIFARQRPAKYLEDVDKLIGNQRVWFVFSHNCSWCKVNEQRFILGYLNEIGLKRDEFQSAGASLYLYDLGQIQ